jgi:hypothetical protein
VDPRVGLDVEKRKLLTLLGLELRPLGRPSRSQSLYRLCYPGSSERKRQSKASAQVLGRLTHHVTFPFTVSITGYEKNE